MKFLLRLVLLVFVLGEPAIADELSDVELMIKNNVDAAIAVLRDKSADDPSRRERILEIVDPVFDFELMARVSLGQKYWTAMSEQDRAEFTKLFVKRLKDSYLEKLDFYTDEQVVHEPAQRVDKRIHVPTQLVTKDNKISMLYKLYKSGRGWKIYDVEIQGVSFIQSFRSQFAAYLKTESINDLLEKLRTPEQFHIDTPEQ